jgi:hypothetical protein
MPIKNPCSDSCLPCEHQVYCSSRSQSNGEPANYFQLPGCRRISQFAPLNPCAPKLFRRSGLIFPVSIHTCSLSPPT